MEINLTSKEEATEEDNRCRINRPNHLALVYRVDVVHLYAYITSRTRTIKHIEFHVLSLAERIAVLLNSNAKISFRNLAQGCQTCLESFLIASEFYLEIGSERHVAEGFARAMDVSCHSFLRMARLAEPLMQQGGSLLTMSYLGADEVIHNYGLMGPVKAALEASVRYLAAELGSAGIRVNAVSPGPVATRAASGIAQFKQLMADAVQRAPLGRLVDIDDVGALCAFLVSDAARSMTGSTLYVDAGVHIMG